MNLQHLLVDTHVHLPPIQILEDITEEDAVRRLPGTYHSIAEIAAHMDFWQSWFLLRCRGGNEPVIASASLGWPGVEAGNWAGIRDLFTKGLTDAAALGSQTDLDAPLAPAIDFPPLADYTVREALVHIANHNSHHLGQIVILRQLLGGWPPPAGSWTW